MKLPKTKAQIRAELDQQVEMYLAKGGDIEAVPRGISGNLDNTNRFANGSDETPRQERTPLTQLVKEMEQRKQSTKHVSRSPVKEGRRKKVLITDDFGEPVRWVWVDEQV